MATTSIWRIKGWLGSVVIYIENPEKTDNPKIYEKQGKERFVRLVRNFGEEYSLPRIRERII